MIDALAEPRPRLCAGLDGLAPPTDAKGVEALHARDGSTLPTVSILESHLRLAGSSLTDPGPVEPSSTLTVFSGAHDTDLPRVHPTLERLAGRVELARHKRFHLPQPPRPG